MAWSKPDEYVPERRASSFVPWKDLAKRQELVSIKAEEFVEKLERAGTKYGPKDTVWANVTVYTGEHAGETFENTPVDKAVIVGQIKNKVGSDPVLGRVYADLDNKGAYTLDAPTDEDFKIAEAAEEKSSKAPF